MAHARRHFAGLLFMLFAIAVDHLRIPMVTCQEGDDTQCLPRKTFFAFLRLPEVSSNLAAYSRTARIIQDARNDFAHLKALSTDDNSDDAKICLPAVVYLEIFSDPAMRAHLGAIERAQRMVEDPEPVDFAALEAEKRSIATLAKNDDLPSSIQERRREEEDEEKRSQLSMTAEELLKMYIGNTQGDLGKSAEDIISEYTLPNGELDVEGLAHQFHSAKRNVAALARDYALPSGRRMGSLAREDSPSNGKRNIGALARDRMLPWTSKRSVASLGRIYILPSLKHWGKRNIGALARDSALPPQGKRYLGSLARSGGLPFIDQKRSISSLARNGMLTYGNVKRNVGTLARDWNLPQTRQGRSLNQLDLDDAHIAENLQILEQESPREVEKSGFEAELVDAKNKSRAKRHVDYSEEYPLPVMQNSNVFDYDDIIEALAGAYPNAEKRFMGTGTSSEGENEHDNDADDDTAQVEGFDNMSRPSKRHIGALARLGWLPSFRAARFSRSPRYLVGREDSADGTASDDTPDSSPWSLGSYRKRPRIRFMQTQGDCRHGFKRYRLLPTDDNNLGFKLHRASSNV